MTTTTSAGPEPSDYTKTRRYAFTDLIIKAISALAIVGIGLITFALQRHVEDLKERDQLRDREERKFLPVLRSSSETAAFLVEVAAQYGWPKGTETEAIGESQLGARLSYAASSLQFPSQEPEFRIIPASDIVNDLPRPRHISLPARQSILLLADVMRLAPLMLDMAKKRATLTVNGEALAFTFAGKTQALSVDERTLGAWRAWLESKPIEAESVYYLDLPTLADDLDRQLTAMNDQVVRDHPNLAKDYIEIRADVLKSRQQLIAH